MNRRGFLAALIGGATLDPERLLWRPGAKLISIPKPTKMVTSGWAGKSILRVGDTVMLRLPGKFEVRGGQLVYIGGNIEFLVLIAS